MDFDQDDEHSFWSRSFTLGATNVRVEEEWGLGIGGTVWEGGVLLAQYVRCLLSRQVSRDFRTRKCYILASPSVKSWIVSTMCSSPAFPVEKYKNGRCIEIGAGITGLPSIAAAHLRTFTQIVVTDIEECMEALQGNISSNLPKYCEILKLNGVTQSSQNQSLSLADPPNSSLDGWDLPQSVLEMALEEEHATKPDCCGSKMKPSEALPVTQYGHHFQNLVEMDKRKKAGEQAVSSTCSCGSGCPDRQTQVFVGCLDWNSNNFGNFHPPFDLLLVADVVYVEELMEALLQCMHSLSNASTDILLAYYERSAAAGKVFWDLIPRFFSVNKIPEGIYGASPHPDHLGLFRLCKL